MDFVHARAKEIESMAAKTVVVGNSRAMQRVPIHMRRRAASHNVKRLPRKLRQRALREMKDYPPKPHHIPSRKRRRRPKNLLEEYTRRKRTKIWLESHIWHAKRFHMREVWGYKLAEHVNDKGARAAYRASGKYCQLWDVSYMCCVELKGPQQELLKTLSRFTTIKTGHVFGSRVTLSGSVAGTTFLYERDRYPQVAIGPVQFMWKPQDNNSENKDYRTLWIWCHPTIHEQVVNELQSAFNLTMIKESSDDMENTENLKSDLILKSAESDDMEDKSVPDTTTDEIERSNVSLVQSNKENTGGDMYKKYPKIPTPKYEGGSGVSMTLLKDSLCRFKLRGQLTHTILSDALRPADITRPDETVQDKEKISYWWQRQDAAQNPGAQNIFSQQSRAWENLQHLPSWRHLPSGLVIGLTIRDPRLFLPKKKAILMGCEKEDNVESENQTTEEEAVMNTDDVEEFEWPDVSSSPVWEESVRTNIKDTMLTDQQINQKRSQLNIPGGLIDLGEAESRVPVLLVHSTPQSPAYLGNKKSCTCETREDYGGGWDLIAPPGWGMAFLIAFVYRGARVGGLRELQTSDFEIGGRPHFPNHFPDTTAGQVSSELSKNELETEFKKRPPAKRVNFTKMGVPEPFQCPWKILIQEWLPNRFQSKEHALVSVLRDLELLSQLDHLLHDAKSWPPVWPDAKHHLVPVTLTTLQKGCCESLSAIYIPLAEDINELHTSKDFGGPVEPLHNSANSKMNSTENGASVVKQETQIRKHCSREVIGYVCEGGFSFRLGRGTGFGYVILGGLISEQMRFSRAPNDVIVLVRANSSLQYRFAALKIHI